jgi:NAD(P)-dependent dehydrogenase (short-subunit alcohol dehydrogenase family)
MARAPVFLVQKLLPLMSRGGSIILVGSAMHLMGIPNRTAYAATKAATRSYARTWAAEFKGRSIRVNTLSPGVTDTPILDAQSKAAGRDEVVEDVPRHDPNRPPCRGRGDRERGGISRVRPELVCDGSGSDGGRRGRPGLRRSREPRGPESLASPQKAAASSSEVHVSP